MMNAVKITARKTATSSQENGTASAKRPAIAEIFRNRPREYQLSTSLEGKIAVQDDMKVNMAKAGIAHARRVPGRPVKLCKIPVLGLTIGSPVCYDSHLSSID